MCTVPSSCSPDIELWHGCLLFLAIFKNPIVNSCIPVSTAQSFPTPMEEPKKVLRAFYLGSMQVTRATGMEILNDAIEHMMTNLPRDQWRSVNVAVAPSMISIMSPTVRI
jgi:hypothetical protein